MCARGPMAVGVLFAGWKGAAVAAGAAAVLVVGWLAAAVLFATDYRDADGWTDCWPNCTALQDVVGIAAIGVPVLFVVLLLGGLAGWMTRRARS
jgi:hypothetical protein